ncbi:hypothetical protein Rvan_2665 [Rhodomicrobium vannielii ATCC 17100]|uniref:Peptidase M15C domain-containing protein n=1 Tax=Rhodomicrobium vannielii (strain ATCC 17100 / DSM 162 / LMG 4299 / NCIMB 10020 / ATH 3.1.1) TaxID=648757 RepID=E3I7F8_RHOVT|nr:hypothetical protein Rvan_2665 [Rhodomicrobium vannielii ATCC 17100]
MRLFAFLMLCLSLVAFCPADAQTLDQKAQALIAAYPDHLASFDGANLLWKDGTKMPFGEERADKPLQELIERPDIADMFHWPYVFGGAALPVKAEADPGRVRNEAFFAKMYGACEKRPAGSCASVSCKPAAPVRRVTWVPKFGGGAMQAATVNGVADKLKAVAVELEALGPAYAKYLVPDGGSHVPRCIARTTRLSVHSFGIAFDINPEHGGYWQYGLPRAMDEAAVREKGIALVYRNKVPPEIVRVFEKHGFIWGGSWYHFDGMHFEYRPEFLALKAIMEK